MSRDYETMRTVLAMASGSGHPLKYGDLYQTIRDEAALRPEIARLSRDGLIDSTVVYQDGDGCCLGGEVSITGEGREFFRLIENEGVWRLVLSTLESAGIDVSYPLLKEVCEEIVKRYVTSFIPDI